MKVLLHLKLNLKIKMVFKLFAVENFDTGEHYIHPHFQSFSFQRVKKKGLTYQFKFILTIPNRTPTVTPPSLKEN